MDEKFWEEREHFLAAIRECPEDYDYRLVYSDWLMEHGFDREASLQRHCRHTEGWLRQYAARQEQLGPKLNGDERYQRLMDYLRWHVDGTFQLPFERQELEWFREYSLMLWDNFATLTTLPPYTPQQAQRDQLRYSQQLDMGVEFTNSIGMRFRLIPPGTFLMGTPRWEDASVRNAVQHRVTLTKPIWFGQNLVTFKEWISIMKFCRNRRVPKEDFKLPVNGIDWFECQEFLNAMNEALASEGWHYRLPTEAEWEYACRAGTMTPYWFGKSCNGTRAATNGIAPFGTTALGPMARFGCGGRYKPNAFGLYDTHGLLREWCHDWLDDDYYHYSPLENPQGPDSGLRKVLRSGSWRHSCYKSTSSVRFGHFPELRFMLIGFRVVAERLASPNSTRL